MQNVSLLNVANNLFLLSVVVLSVVMLNVANNLFILNVVAQVKALILYK
jgi:hypothetical protein